MPFTSGCPGWAIRGKQSARRRFRRCHTCTGVWVIRSGFAQRTCSMRNSFLLGSILTVAVGNAASSAEVIYNSIPSTLNPNYTSQPYQAQQISEFGDRVSFAGSARQLSSASITLSCWARYQDYNVGGQYYGTGAFAGDGRQPAAQPGSGEEPGHRRSGVLVKPRASRVAHEAR